MIIVLNSTLIVKNTVTSKLIAKNRLFSIQPGSIDTFNILIRTDSIVYTKITSKGLLPLNCSSYSLAAFIKFTI